MVRTRLAVEVGHLRRVVARSGGEARRYRRVDAREVGGIEFQGEGPEALRELRRGGVFFVSDLPQCLDQFQVLLKITLLITRHADNADIALIGRGWYPTAENSARQDAISGYGDAKRERRGQNAPLNATTHERVFDLQIGDRVHGLRAPDGLDPDFRQADM